MTHSSHIQVEGDHSPGCSESYVLSIATAIFTFVLGFGALVILDLATPPVAGEVRLYSFWSTMLGYSLFLPGALAGWQLTRSQFPPTNTGRAVGVLVGLIAAASMLFSQGVWILDPAPRPNWTLAAPHDFNLLGWYNTAFTVSVFSIAGYITGDLFTRLNSATGMRVLPSERRQAAMSGLSLGVAGLLGFGVTVLLDNVGYLEHFSSQATVINTLLITGILILVLWLMLPDTRSLHAEP